MFVCIVERTFYIFSPEMMNYRPASSRPPAVPDRLPYRVRRGRARGAAPTHCVEMTSLKSRIPIRP